MEIVEAKDAFESTYTSIVYCRHELRSPDFDYMARNVYVANIIKFYFDASRIILAEMKTSLCCLVVV